MSTYIIRVTVAIEVTAANPSHAEILAERLVRAALNKTDETRLSNVRTSETTWRLKHE